MSLSLARSLDRVDSPARDNKDSVCGEFKYKGIKRTRSGDDYMSSKKRKKTRKWFKKIKRPASEKLPKTRSKNLRTKPEAPFNSTQYIMNEHDKLNDSDLSSNSRPRRNRDSSISMDSEEYDLYSSEEDEEFLKRDFWTTYEDAHAEVLDALPHNQLVQEYLSLEDKINLLEREFLFSRERDRLRIREPSPGAEEEVPRPGEVPVDAETAAKIEIFKSEIKKLETENLRLKRDATTHQKPCRRCHGHSSSSSCSSDVNSSESSDDDQASEPSPQISLPVAKELEIVSVAQTKIVDHQSDSGLASLEGGSSGDDVRPERNLRSI